jgi:hypothetical protein
MRALGLLAMLSACGGVVQTQPRLAGTCATQHDLLRRELDRVDRSPPLVGARILDTLGSEVRAHGEQGWDCAGDLADTLYGATFADTPVVASRLLVARIRAVGELQDFVGVMARKAKFLLAIARTDDTQLTAYQPFRDEPGPPPSRAWIRSLAVRYLARSNVELNNGPAHAFLRDRRAAPASDEERLDLFRPMAWNDALKEPAGAAIVRGFVADLDHRLASPADPVSLEVAILETRMLGAYGPRVQAIGEAAVFDRIIAASGDVPLTHGIAGADDDLLIAAANARVLVAAGGLDHNYSMPAAIVPRRPLVSRGEPAGGMPESAARIHDLDSELARPSHQPPCRPIEELARTLPADEAARRWDALTDPMFPGDKLYASPITACTLRATLEMEQVDAVKRRALIHRVLAHEKTAYTVSGSDYGNSDIGFPSLVSIIGRALAAHPAWLDDDDELRRWILDAGPALLEDTTRGVDDSALNGGFAIALVHAATHDPEATRAVVYAWITELGATPIRPNLYVTEWRHARILLIAALAGPAGLADDARALFATLTDPPVRAAATTVLDAVLQRPR